MKLTQKEMTLLFEVAKIGSEGCGMWLTELVNDNYSWFEGSDVMGRLNWSKEKVGGVMASLSEKGLICCDPAGKELSFLNINDSDDLYQNFKEWEKDYPKYCDNPFAKEDQPAKKHEMKQNTSRLLQGAIDTMGKVIDKIDPCINGNSTFDNEREMATGEQKKTFRQLKGDCVSAIDDLRFELDHIYEEQERIVARSKAERSESKRITLSGNFDYSQYDDEEYSHTDEG